MLIEEMSNKIYKWQKRNQNNKHNFTKDLAGAYGVFCGAGSEFELRHCRKCTQISGL